MKNVIYGDRTFQLKTELSEIDLPTFQKLLNVLNMENEYFFDVYLESMKILGLPDEVVEDINEDEIYECIKCMRLHNFIEFDENNIVRSFEMDGYTYSAFPQGETFRYKSREFKLIEKFTRLHKNDYCKYIMAVTFKRDDLTIKEHYDETHIKHKAELFEKMDINVAVYYLLKATDKITRFFELFTIKK